MKLDDIERQLTQDRLDLSITRIDEQPYFPQRLGNGSREGSRLLRRHSPWRGRKEYESKIISAPRDGSRDRCCAVQSADFNLSDHDASKPRNIRRNGRGNRRRISRLRNGTTDHDIIRPGLNGGTRGHGAGLIARFASHRTDAGYDQ